MRCRQATPCSAHCCLCVVQKMALLQPPPCYAGCASQVASFQLGKEADRVCTDTAVQSGNEQKTKNIDVEMGVSCNSHSMGFAFLHTGMRTAKCMVLRQESGAEGCQHDYKAFCCFGSQHSYAA